MPVSMTEQMAVALSAAGVMEAAGYFSEDIPADNKDEQLVTAFLDTAPELEARLCIGFDRQQPVKAAIQTASRPFTALLELKYGRTTSSRRLATRRRSAMRFIGFQRYLYNGPRHGP